MPARARVIDRLLAIPLWLIITPCYVLPLVWLVGQVLFHPVAWAELKFTPFRVSLLGRTLLYNGAVAFLATLLSLPAALVVGRGRGASSRLLAFLLPLPLLLPSITYAY